MTQYLGYIALIPRTDAASGWVRDHLPRKHTAVLEAFCSDEAWDGYPHNLGDPLRVPGSTQYTAWQYGDDTLVIVCQYQAEYLAPGGKFAADVQLHEGANLTELTEEEILPQVRRVLRLS